MGKEFWTKVDDDKLDLSRQPSRFDRSLSNPTTSMPRWLLPADNFQMDRVRDDEFKWEITLDVQNFKPEELKVSTMPDNSVVIEGKHEEKSGAGSYVQNQFKRQFTLPSACNPL